MCCWLDFQLAVLLAILISSISRAHTRDQENFALSGNVNTFLESVLGGCSIRFIGHPQRSSDQKIFNLMQEKRNKFVQSKTFIVDKYKSVLAPLIAKDNGGFAWFDSYEETIWQFRRHTFCHVHLYLLETAKDLYDMVNFHFPDFDLRRDRPDYLLMWDMGLKYEDILQTAKLQEFYGTFMDYRLIIAYDRSSNEFDIKLVCLVCPWTYPTQLMKSIEGRISQEKIAAVWVHSHTDHFGGKAIHCYPCFFKNSNPAQKSPVFHWFVIYLFNATQDFQTLGFNSRGRMISAIFTRAYLSQYFLSAVYPSQIWPPSFVLKDDYYMFTVARRTLLKTNGWNSFLLPMQNSVWLTILLGMIGVIVIRRVTQNCESFSITLLRVFGTLTDHWLISSSDWVWKVILGLWGTLCFSFTILYGGDLASSLSVLAPPLYSKDVLDFGRHSGEFISMQMLFKGLAQIGAEYYSPFARILQDSPAVLNPKNVQKIRARNLKRVLRKIQRSVCPWKYLYLSRENKQFPYRCKSKQKPIRTDVPTTYVDPWWLSMSAKSAFDSSDLYWVSRMSASNDFAEYQWLVLGRNYFAKLVSPLVSYWMAGGLETYARKQLDVYKSKVYFYSHVRSIPKEEIILKSFSRLDFKPVSIRSLLYVFGLVMICLTFSALVFILEFLSAYHRPDAAVSLIGPFIKTFFIWLFRILTDVKGLKFRLQKIIERGKRFQHVTIKIVVTSNHT